MKAPKSTIKASILKTSLDHLPFNYQQDLLAIKKTILKHVPAEMIILFGSYAKGNYVVDVKKEDGTFYEYTSDYDILVVTEQQVNSDQWRELEKAADKRPTPIPYGLINHSITYLNEQIRYNYYFFTDISKEGIMLYNSGRYKLAAPEQLTPAKQLEKAEEYFGNWMRKGDTFFKGVKFFREAKEYNAAAFLLHQAVEIYYAAFLLVLTDYKPKTHDLEELRKRAIKMNPAHQRIFAINSQEDEDRWVLLCKAYIDARYSKDYSITPEELQYLAEQAIRLHHLVRKLCYEHIEKLE